jgi:peptidoglycan/LPS O-acetylase OafA/YrhL
MTGHNGTHESAANSPGTVLQTFSNRFLFLDGLRGIAALAVMFLHLNGEFGLFNFMQHGYLAVDFFFCLSGFVIAHAYRRKLESTMSLSVFARLRFARLYPMAFAGYVIAILVHLTTHAALEPYFTVVATLGLLMIPIPIDAHVQYPNMFPLNPPFWTLFCEFSVNLLYAKICRRGKLPLIIIGLCSEVILIILAFHAGTINVADVPKSVVYSMFRTIFSFLMGVLLYNFSERFKSPPVNGFLIIILLMCLFAVPDFRVDHRNFSALFDLVAVTAIIPSIIFFGSKTVVTSPFVNTAKFSGWLSYPFYAIHFPMILYLKYLTSSEQFSRFETQIYASIFILASLFFSAGIAAIIDQPFRSLLKQILIKRYHPDK